jgi:hypothetical protein
MCCRNKNYTHCLQQDTVPRTIFHPPYLPKNSLGIGCEENISLDLLSTFLTILLIANLTFIVRFKEAVRMTN